MADLLTALRSDLIDEGDNLLAVLSKLDEHTWGAPTLCPPWAVKDHISHLAWNDQATVFALTQPDVFRAAKPLTAELIQDMVDRVIVDNHHRSGADMLSWFATARADMLTAFEGRDPRERMPWYGPDMSIVSKLTARFMETWAHGYDITEALGIVHQPTDRSRHVVFLGLQAIPNAFVTRGLPVPVDPVRIEAVAPSGAILHFGRADAENVVRGSLFELALIVTQRRHLSDTELIAEGPVAHQWLQVAQAFAGPAGSGRAPVQSHRSAVQSQRGAEQ
jgi:uncharacterized protein (TIGR03084 family)